MWALNTRLEAGSQGLNPRKAPERCHAGPFERSDVAAPQAPERCYAGPFERPDVAAPSAGFHDRLAVFGLCCVVLLGYALHRGLYIGKHIDYWLDARYECNLATCRTVPGYQLHCTYWSLDGTFRESGGFSYPTYDEAAEHSYCRVFRI